MSNSLTYFRVDGSYLDVEQPIPGNTGTIAPQLDEISAYVDFFPGTQDKASEGGFACYVPDFSTFGDTELALAPITARTINGKLCSITIGDPQGVDLIANSAWLRLYADDALFYHVRYRNVTYGGALQRFSRFAFRAPTDTTPVLLTSPSLPRYDYRGP